MLNIYHVHDVFLGGVAKVYDLKHKRPKDQEASRFLTTNMGKIHMINRPILDLACGYGRNGAYFLRQNCRVLFIDNDVDCLRFISEMKIAGAAGHFDQNNIKILKKNLTNGRLPFPDASVGGIIDVHYYSKPLIPESLRVLAPGGFYYFESIDARGNNVYELPEYGYIKHCLEDYEIVDYKEKLAKPYCLGKGTIKVIAIKHKN